MDNKQQPKNPKKTPNQFDAYVKYSSLAIQMMLIILLPTYGGFRLDKYLGWKFPIFTVVLSILGVGAAIWYAVKDLLKK